MEREERDGENGDESVDTGALIWRENLPPTDGAVGQDHGHVEGDHGGQNNVEIMQADHFLWFSRKLDQSFWGKKKRTLFSH